MKCLNCLDSRLVDLVETSLYYFHLFKLFLWPESLVGCTVFAGFQRMDRTNQRKNKKIQYKNGNDWGDLTPTRCHVWEISLCCCFFCQIRLCLCTLVLSSSVFKMTPFIPRLSPWRHTYWQIHPKINDYSKKPNSLSHHFQSFGTQG